MNGNPDRLQTHVPGTDPAPLRRPCGCRGRRGQHQGGCPLRGLSKWLFWTLGLRGEEALRFARRLSIAGLYSAALAKARTHPKAFR